MSPWNRLGTSFWPPRMKKIVLKPWKYAMFEKSSIKKTHICDLLKTVKIGVSCKRERNIQFFLAQKWFFLGKCKSAESSWRPRKSTKIWFFRGQAALFAVTSESAFFEGCSTRNARFLRNHYKNEWKKEGLHSAILEGCSTRNTCFLWSFWQKKANFLVK